MSQRRLAWFVASVVVWSACGSPETGDEWAAEAQAWHDSLRAAQIVEGGAAYQRYLSPDVVWDDCAVYAGGCGSDPTVGNEAIENAAWALGPESLRLERDVFISVDGLVDFWFYDWAPLGNDVRADTQEPAHGVSLMTPIGASGAQYFVNGRATQDWGDLRAELPEVDQGEAVATLWTRVWSGSRDDVDALYHRDARLRDTIAGVDLTGRDVIAGLARADGQWQITTVDPDNVRGVYAFILLARPGSKELTEVVIVVSGHDEIGCAGEMAVWLTLDDGLVAEEVRYWPIERARRCLPTDDLPDGWWTDRPVPDRTPPTTRPFEDLDTPTDPVVVGDVSIAVRNGTADLNRLVAWALGRFDAAGLTPPTITSVTFTLYSERCDDFRAYWHATPEGDELTYCFDEDLACRDDTCAGFTPAGRAAVLHELAHAWMHATLDEDVERRFADHVRLEVWDDRTVAWDRRAVEHAAETISWGLMDREVRMLMIGNPDPEHLAAGFRILTGRDPQPRTDEP